MARTVKNRKRFQFRIAIIPSSSDAHKSQWVGTNRWKHRALYLTKMRLWIQLQKASNRSNWKWYKFYTVRGYGAPGRGEFICPYSGMIAKTINQEEAACFRRYWSVCSKKTAEILNWLNTINVSSYSKELNHYLIRLIVVKFSIREQKTYQKIYPFTQGKQWVEL